MYISSEISSLGHYTTTAMYHGFYILAQSKVPVLKAIRSTHSPFAAQGGAKMPVYIGFCEPLGYFVGPDLSGERF